MPISLYIFYVKHDMNPHLIKQGLEMEILGSTGFLLPQQMRVHQPHLALIVDAEIL